MTEQTTASHRGTSGDDPGRPSTIRGLIKACRPKQWAKNVLVFVAPAAAGVLDDPYYLKHTLVGFVAGSDVVIF